MLARLLTSSLVALAGASPVTARTAITSRNLTHGWEILPTGSQQQFRGLSPISDKIAWVSGTGGTVLRTIDGGTSWESVGPPLAGDEAELQFRDIQAFSAEKAIILSIGEGTDSRIYITSDGGKSWRRLSPTPNLLLFTTASTLRTMRGVLQSATPLTANSG
ncbi:oxidoreductase [Colletotrichum tofieldiae]|nr:oxidoreductase [Colletotrichum tofieldiae]